VHIEIELSPGDCAKFVAIPWILQPVPALQQLPLALLTPLCDMLRFTKKYPKSPSKFFSCLILKKVQLSSTFVT